MRAVDLNADLGEECGDDAGLLAIISSANIAAGGHAGGGEVMHRTVRLAAAMGVAVGAHPSYPDRESFGRASMTLGRPVLVSAIASQIVDVARACDGVGVPVTHVKAHGALYNEAMVDRSVAASFLEGSAQASAIIGYPLPVFGLPGSVLQELAVERFVAEGFVDRGYASNGQLVPRSDDGALLETTDRMIEQALDLVVNSRVVAADGARIPLFIETLCLHGDTPDAVTHALAVRSALEERGVTVKPW